MERLEALARWIRGNGVGIGAALVLAFLASLAVRWILKSRETPPPRKVVQFTMVNIDRPPPPRTPPPPPPPQPQQKVEEKVDEPQANRVEMKAMDMPPDAPPPPPGGGQLALAAEGEGPGDAFNLAGNPGGKGLLSGGVGLGDGSGSGLGGDGTAQARYSWYYTKVQLDIEALLRKSKRLATASVDQEVRISWDDSGRVTLAKPVRSSGDPALDREYEAIVLGITLRNPPPPDVPKPVVLRIRARRPQ